MFNIQSLQSLNNVTIVNCEGKLNLYCLLILLQDTLTGVASTITSGANYPRRTFTPNTIQQNAAGQQPSLTASANDLRDGTGDNTERI
jgi:hypothetical protein